MRLKMRLKINKRIILLFAVTLIVFFMTTTASAVSLDWFDDNQSQTEFLNQSQLQPYLKVYDGNIVDSIFVQLGWSLIKFAYWITSTIQDLVPQALSLFKFVQSTGVNKTYESVLNTIVVGLMIISLVVIGYKMVLGKGTTDLKSVGMNIVISVSLIILMPTVISSGQQFAEKFYNDSTSISGGNGDVAWSLIKNGVTDLAYINKTDGYDKIDHITKRNNLKKENFNQIDFSQVLTSDVLDKLEKENSKAENLRYKLVPDSDNKMIATKFDDNFLSVFSDSLKTGYYRYPTNILGVLIGEISLAIAYVFSAFIIISAIIELAFKRVLGVLVFATDLESGQRSKMVLSDIFQCYLTVGFQGFSLGMFGLFVNYLNSGDGAGTNIFLKAIAYVGAVFMLIKGSGTIMRYFGVDVGLKEGHGQLASAMGLGAMMMRKGSSLGNRAKNMGGKNDGQPNGEDTNNKPEKNFGESLANKAQSTGKKVGYARERGISGLASDGISMATDRATKPFKNMRNVARNGMDSFKEGVVDGAVSASLAKSRKENNASGSQGNDKVVSSSERMRAMEQNQSAAKAGATGATAMSAVQQKVQQDIEQRKNAMHNASRLASEEIINQRRNEAKYTPEAREEMIRQRTQGLSNADTSNREVSVRENLQGATGSQSRTVDVRENLQGATGSQSRTVDVKENLQGATGSQSRTVDVRENLQGATGSQSRTVDVRENLQSSTSSQPKERIVNVVENVRDSKSGTNKETVVVDKEVRENKRKRFTYEDNDLFRDRSNDPNPLFDK